MSAGDVWAGKSPSYGQTDNPGYGVLHVMPLHLANTHDCCCQAALDKQNVLPCCSGSWGKLGAGPKGQIPAEHRQIRAFLRGQEVATAAQATQSGSWQGRSSFFFCDTGFFFPLEFTKRVTASTINKSWTMSSSSLFLLHGLKPAYTEATEGITLEVHGFVIRTSLSISHIIVL